MWILGLLTLWLIPIAAYSYARRRVPERLWLSTGASFGAIVAPASMGLYGFYFVGPIVAPVGLVGLPLVLLHGAPGYYLAVLLGFVPAATVVHGAQHIAIDFLNGLVWSLTYGLFGVGIDAVRKAQLNAEHA